MPFFLVINVRLLPAAFAAFFLLLGTLPAVRAQMKPRPPLAVGAAFDDSGRLWRVRLLDGNLVVDASTDRGASFSAPVRVTPAPEPVAADGELRPEIAVAGKRVYVAWTSPLPQPYAGNVRFARSVDGGRSFEAPLTVNDNREAITHRFQSLFVDAGGNVAMAWIDKRDLVAAKAAGKDYRGAAIYAATSTDGGASFGANRRVAAHSCECCRIALAGDFDGQPLALWRHVFVDGTRDHALARLDAAIGDDDPGRATAQRWQVNACPHHGPDLAVGADGIRHGVWFNQSEGEPGLFYGTWNREGAAVGKPMRIGTANAAHPAVLVLGRRVLLAWKAFDGDNTVASVMESDDDGQRWTPPRAVATAADASDHPRLLAFQGQPYLSWSAQREGYRLIPLAAPGGGR